MVPFIRRTALALSLLLAAPPSCGTLTTFDPLLACPDSQNVDLHVSSGNPPRFTWSPSCGMASLDVRTDTSAGPAWVVYTGPAAPDNPLPSGVVYGQTPPHGVVPSPAQSLVPGVTYHVRVYRWIGQPPGPGSLFQRGGATFTR